MDRHNLLLEPIGPEHEHIFLPLIEDFARHDKEWFLQLFGDQRWDARAFQKFVKECNKQRMDWRPKAGKISVSHYVLIAEQRACGYGRLRFPIDPEGELGNLEFFVPPTLRQKGYGTHTLNKLLFEAVRSGLARALVTCQAGNHFAARCIEHNRGEKIEDGKRILDRFWIRFR